MKKILILVIIAFCFSCNKKKTITPYIISYEERKIKEHCDSLKKSGSNLSCFPLKGYYGENQIVITNQGKFYYYQREYFGGGCGTDKEKDTLPMFIDLQPNAFKILSKNEIEKFIEKNVMTKEKRRQILIIASQNDTIKDKDFLKFLYRMRVPTYAIRRTTQEEDTVLSYVGKDKLYNPEKIKWDTTKIKINSVKFLKQKD